MYIKIIEYSVDLMNCPINKMGLFPTKGHADPPPRQKCPHQKVIVNGAQCSESNGKNNKQILRFLLFELLKIWVIFSEKLH